MSESARVLKESKPVQNVYTIHEKLSEFPKKMNSFELVMSQMNIASVDDFNQAYSQQWQSAAMEKELLSVLVCEVDFYHAYVENHGEQGASFMMVSIALLLKNICEKNDYFLSFNDHHGFSVLIKGNTPEEVFKVAAEFCDAVKASKVAHEKSKVNNIVTLSVGTSSFYPTTPSTFKEDAQKALDKAKNGGGNTVRDVSFIKPIELMAITDVKDQLPTEKTLEAAIKSDQMTAVKEENLESEQLTRNSQPFDFFAENEQEKVVTTRMYRGQVIESEMESNLKGAPTTSETALNGSNKETIEVKKKKTKPVRMYRGQIIQD